MSLPCGGKIIVDINISNIAQPKGIYFRSAQGTEGNKEKDRKRRWIEGEDRQRAEIEDGVRGWREIEGKDRDR